MANRITSYLDHAETADMLFRRARDEYRFSQAMAKVMGHMPRELTNMRTMAHRIMREYRKQYLFDN